MTQQEFIERMNRARSPEEMRKIREEYAQENPITSGLNFESQMKSNPFEGMIEEGIEDIKEQMEDLPFWDKPTASEQYNEFAYVQSVIENFTPSDLESEYMQKYHIENNNTLKRIFEDAIIRDGVDGVARRIKEKYDEIVYHIDKAQHDSGTHDSHKGSALHPSIDKFAELLKGAKLSQEEYEGLSRENPLE